MKRNILVIWCFYSFFEKRLRANGAAAKCNFSKKKQEYYLPCLPLLLLLSLAFYIGIFLTFSWLHAYLRDAFSSLEEYADIFFPKTS